MPEVEVNLSAGILRMSRRALDAVAALASPGPEAGAAAVDAVAAGTLDPLREAGLLDATGLHPMISPIAAALAAPVVRLRFLDLGPGPAVESPGWVSPDVAVLALPGPAGLDVDMHEIVAVDTPFLPHRLAALAGLGPRPAHWITEPLKADPGLFEAILSGLAATVSDIRSHVGPTVPQPLIEAVLEFSGNYRRHWRVSTAWGDSPGPIGGRSVEAVESPTGRLWRVERPSGEQGGVVLSPATPTGLWRLFIGLLPGDDEL